MIRHIKTTSPFGPGDSATIIIDKNGMRVENKSENATYEKDDYFYRNLIKTCLDLDSWKFSWHLNLDGAMRKRTNDRKKCREIMSGKIKEREAEIQLLKDGLQVLGRTG